MIIRDTIRVLYSPLKAFEEIAKAPDVKGPLLILLITLLASASVHYISSSKTLLETEKGDAYTPLTATEVFNVQLITTLRDIAFLFFLRWLTYGVTFLFILKLFRAKEGPWHQLFIIIGHLLIVAAFFIFVDAIIFSTLPDVSLDFEVWSGALEGNEEMFNVIVRKYDKTWGSSPAYQLRDYFPIIVATWTAFLGAVAIHFLREVSWNKAIVISAIVSVISLFLMGPLAF